jgi:hypothetical protein
MHFGSQQHILHDQQIVRVLLPVRDGRPLSMEGVVKLVSTSFVEILFPLEKFSAVDLDREGEWLIIWEKAENVLSARARLNLPVEGSRVRLEITGFFFQSSERRYPRIDAEVYLKYWAASRQEQTVPPAVRQKINISGCGMRFLSEEAYAAGEQVGLEISLPGPTLEVVRCVGSVVWTRKYTDLRHEVALDIMQIPRLDLDKVLNFCIVEQFKQLHSRVRVMGTVMSPALEKLAPDRGQRTED